MNGIETNYEIAVWILKEGKRKPGNGFMVFISEP